MGRGYEKGFLKNIFVDHVREGAFIRHGVAFSPDGKHLASGGSGDEAIYVRNVESGSLVTKPFIGHKGGVYSVSYSSD